MNPSHKSANLPDVPNDTRNGLHSTIADMMEIPIPTQPEPDDLLSAFGLLDWNGLMNRPPKQWLVHEVFGAGDLVLLYGESGSGKTFVIVDLLLACCTGGTWAGRFDVSRPLNVAYCAGEGLGGLAQRFRAAAYAAGLDSVPNLTVAQTVPSLFHDSGSEAHVASIERFVIGWQTAQKAGTLAPLDILVIDTLHSATVGADENSARDAGRILQLAKLAAINLGCTVILVHHANKSGGERGSTAFRGAMDAVLSVSKIGDGSQSVMLCEKLKDGSRWVQNIFSLVEISECASARVWWNDPADEVAVGKGDGDREAIIKLLGDGYALTGKAIGQGIGMGESKQIYKLLERLEADNKITKRLQDESRRDSSRNPWVYEIVK